MTNAYTIQGKTYSTKPCKTDTLASESRISVALKNIKPVDVNYFNLTDEMQLILVLALFHRPSKTYDSCAQQIKLQES